MGEPVQQGTGEALRAQHLGPFVEGQVAVTRVAPRSVTETEDLEQHLGPVFDSGTNPSSSMISSS